MDLFRPSLVAPHDRLRFFGLRSLSNGAQETGQALRYWQVCAFEPVDLAQVGFLSVGDVLFAAQSRQIDLGVHRAETTLIGCHTAALRILVRNLLDNAVKYTPVGGTVDLDVRSTHEGDVLCVEDNGPGIPEADRERVLDRFYRASGSASTVSGLGLAIVKAIASLHGAVVILDTSARLGGLRVRVIFKREVSLPTNDNHRA